MGRVGTVGRVGLVGSVGGVGGLVVSSPHSHVGGGDSVAHGGGAGVVVVVVSSGSVSGQPQSLAVVPATNPIRRMPGKGQDYHFTFFKPFECH